MKSETAEKFKRRVDVLLNAVYNIVTKIKGDIQKGNEGQRRKVYNTYEISAEIVKEHGTLVTD